MKNFKKLLITGLVIGMLTAASAFAATQGTEGATSTGTSDLSVTVEQIVKITDVADLTVASYTGGAGGFDQNDDVCIYSNDGATGTYEVTITGGDAPGTGAGASFNVGNATTNDAVPFTVAWNDVSGTAGGAAVTHTTPLTGQTNPSASVTCGGSNNANFRVVMTQANLLAVNPGAYTNTITILITPE